MLYRQAVRISEHLRQNACPSRGMHTLLFRVLLTCDWHGVSCLFSTVAGLRSSFCGLAACSLTCKVKRQYLLTLQVSRYCLLTLLLAVFWVSGGGRVMAEGGQCLPFRSWCPPLPNRLGMCGDWHTGRRFSAHWDARAAAAVNPRRDG